MGGVLGSGGSRWAAPAGASGSAAHDVEQILQAAVDVFVPARPPDCGVVLKVFNGLLDGCAAVPEGLLDEGAATLPPRERGLLPPASAGGAGDFLSPAFGTSRSNLYNGAQAAGSITYGTGAAGGNLLGFPIGSPFNQCGGAGLPTLQTATDPSGPAYCLTSYY
ncbi:hypothetical protein [Streptomyces sp. NPDC059994]|uniref:hypothetical protein n=1 Tax=Streptomyces sp. NPDC059994 TaxID=3347029 RepID=UPI0036907436